MEMMEPTDLTRPIIGIANRTPQEVFDIMVSRIELIATPVFHVAPDLSAEDFERIKRTAERQPMLPGTPPPSPLLMGRDAGQQALEILRKMALYDFILGDEGDELDIRREAKGLLMEVEIGAIAADIYGLLTRILGYLEGGDPNATSGGIRNKHLREEVRAALATATSGSGE